MTNAGREMDYLSRLFKLDGKTAAIVGGAGFLCSEMASALSKAGVRVAILDRDAEATNAVVSKINKEGGAAIGVPLQVTEKTSHEVALRRIIEEFGGLDILVNGAGINAPTPFFDITVEEWKSILDSHATGTFLGCQVFGRHMVEKKRGSIINLSSASAGPPLSKAFAYSVAKAGIRNLTQNLAREWAPHNVRVNALRPGFFPTEWSKKNFMSPERERAILGHTPMARYGRPEELTGAVLWLASEASGFVTGAEIAVDGGFTAMTI
jgi:NAD(P)-dependent dehydrogenase (short-subunit alcohol dehydrogenase family)